MNTVYERIRDSLHQRGLYATLNKGVNHLIYSFLYRECKKSFGEANKTKTIYVIRSVCENSKYYKGARLNLLANFSYVLSHMLYAQERGWIPVVDQLNYPVYNQESFPVHGSINPWEYYWQQPGGCSLEEAYMSKNVVLSARNWYEPGNLKYSVEAHMDRATILRFHKLINEIPLNKQTSTYKHRCVQDILCGHGRVLGVSMRSGGHSLESSYHALGHPIQPTREELLYLIIDRMKTWKIDAVFLTTEDQDNIDYFKNYLGECLLYLPRERYYKWKPATKDNPDILHVPGKQYQTGLNYLMEMELLAECDALIGSVTSGLRYAILRNGGRFKYLEVLDKGVF